MTPRSVSLRGAVAAVLTGAAVLAVLAVSVVGRGAGDDRPVSGGVVSHSVAASGVGPQTPPVELLLGVLLALAVTALALLAIRHERVASRDRRERSAEQAGSPPALVLEDLLMAALRKASPSGPRNTAARPPAWVRRLGDTADETPDRRLAEDDTDEGVAGDAG